MLPILRIENGFGRNWVPIIIDYIYESHPNYQLITASMIASIKFPLEKLYFVPSIKHKLQNMEQAPKYDEIESQINEGGKQTFQ